MFRFLWQHQYSKVRLPACSLCHSLSVVLNSLQKANGYTSRMHRYTLCGLRNWLNLFICTQIQMTRQNSTCPELFIPCYLYSHNQNIWIKFNSIEFMFKPFRFFYNKIFNANKNLINSYFFENRMKTLWCPKICRNTTREINWLKRKCSAKRNCGKWQCVGFRVPHS